MNTAFHPTPIPWSEFPAECFWYLAPMSVVHLAAFVIGCIVLVVFSRKQGMLLRRISRLGLFISLFLVVGSLFNGLWSCLVWDRLYDSTDYVFDFVPFWPITQSMIDRLWGDGRGQLLGVSLFQLQLVWFLFAVGTWGATIFLYRLVRGHRPADKSPEPSSDGALSSAVAAPLAGRRWFSFLR
jgi:hypothetical protein